MKLSRIVIIVVVIVIVAAAASLLVGLLSPPPPECTATWKCGAQYPIQVGGTYGIAGQQCVNITSTVYCIGGQDANSGPRDEIFYGTPSSSGNITAWSTNLLPYPLVINGHSCVSQNGYVYCIGGSYNDAGDDVATSYFVQASSGTLGNWSRTTSFPIPIDTQSCVASSSYIYCVGGNNETDGSNADASPSNSVWFAELSSTGVGAWKHTTTYPGGILFPSCASWNGYIYCLGGADSSGNSQDAAYYAPLSTSGVGAWEATTAYPVQASGEACIVSFGYVYCVGGVTNPQNPSFTNAVYYATVTPTGIGKWQQAPSFPVSTATNCVVVYGNIYCVGGFEGNTEDNVVNYASLASLRS